MAAADQEPHASAVRPRSYQDESYLHGFLGSVGDLQKAGVLQDVVLEVEGRRFPCHRLVLSAASPYFRAMFTSDMAESRQITVVLQGLDAGMFGEILSYIYSGTLHVSLDKVQPLYQAADILQLAYVRDTCSSYMAMNVECFSCMDLYKFADDFSVDIVQKSCQQWIVKHFTEVASSEEFCSLSVNQLTEIISHDELDVKEETIVWEAVVRWVQHSREDRLHRLPSILPHIRFNLLTSDDTAAILEHPLVRKDPRSLEVISSAETSKGNPNLKPRLGMFTEMVLLLKKESSEILFMNPREGKYISCSYKPEDLPPVAGVTVTCDNDIYILKDDMEPEDDKQLSMYKYNHAENVWQHTGMSSVSSFLWSSDEDWITYQEDLIEVDRILYYLGIEIRNDNTLVKMRKYNRQTDQWQDCSLLQFNETLHHSSALPCGSYIFFLTNEEVHRYDPTQDQWSKRTTPTLIPKVGLAAAIGTEIFCTDLSVNQTMVYDTESDKWQELKSLPTSYSSIRNARLFVMENQLYLVLRVSKFDTVKQKQEIDYHVHMYDRSADSWRDMKVAVTTDAYAEYELMCPVARMYLPYLGAHAKP
ncbi:kelch repeat and BTB domain-containing protein 2-like [Branchiostoma lanceolatum]|uniref:kelch repeat and BTB domain-containing protein 2-like n=1 Tax=Branchiostoma lanceolatum TaxID=7740 RepID=UPI0034534D9F